MKLWCFFRDSNGTKMTHSWIGLTIFGVFIIVDMKCDTSVTGKIGLFGSTFCHLTYQNLDYEACMLDIWFPGMSQNSYYYQQNDWWAETVIFCLPNHVFLLAHFIGEIA